MPSAGRSLRAQTDSGHPRWHLRRRSSYLTLSNQQRSGGLSSLDRRRKFAGLTVRVVGRIAMTDYSPAGNARRKRRIGAAVPYSWKQGNNISGNITSRKVRQGNAVTARAHFRDSKIHGRVDVKLFHLGMLCILRFSSLRLRSATIFRHVKERQLRVVAQSNRPLRSPEEAGRSSGVASRTAAGREYKEVT